MNVGNVRVPTLPLNVPPHFRARHPLLCTRFLLLQDTAPSVVRQLTDPGLKLPMSYMSQTYEYGHEELPDDTSRSPIPCLLVSVGGGETSLAREVDTVRRKNNMPSKSQGG